jgi:hypothetical protein
MDDSENEQQTHTSKIYIKFDPVTQKYMYIVSERYSTMWFVENHGA